MRDAVEDYIQLPVLLSGTYKAGTAAYFDSIQQQWYPGDPIEVSDFTVILIINDTRIDITGALNRKELALLESEYIEKLQALTERERI